MSGKNSAGGASAKGANKYPDSAVVDNLLWSDTPEEEYLKQILEGSFDDEIETDEENGEESSSLPGAIKMMDDIVLDENVKRNLTTNFEQIFRFGKKAQNEEGSGKSAEREAAGSVGVELDEDNNTVDEMIEASEREEETNLNNILERIPINSNSVSTHSSAITTRTKNIRMNVGKTVQSKEGSHAVNSNQKRSLTGAMNNIFSSSAGSKGNKRNANDSLAGDDTVGKIVTRIMEGGDSTVAGGEEERTMHSWTDFQPIAGSITTPMSNNAAKKNPCNNKFVNDETSVGSITEEIQVIVAKHRREFDQDVGAIEQLSSKEGTIPNTMVSSLSVDETQYPRVRLSQEGIPSVSEKSPGTPPRYRVEEGNVNDIEAGESWWVEAEKVPSTPLRNSDETPSPSNSVGKPKAKEAPGTPSTVIIKGHILGLVTPTNSEQGFNHCESVGTNSHSKSSAGWASLGFLKRATAKHGLVFKWMICAVVVLLLISIGLAVFAGFYVLGNSDTNSNEKPSPPAVSGGNNHFVTIANTIDSSDSALSSSFDFGAFVGQEDVLTLVDTGNVASKSDGDDSVTDDFWDSTIVPNDSDPGTDDFSDPTATPNPSTDGSAGSLEGNESEDLLSNLIDLQPPADEDAVVRPDIPLVGADFNDGDFIETRVKQILSKRLPESLPKLNDLASPQSRALEWIRSNPPTMDEVNTKPLLLEQKYALSVLYFSTNGEEWEDNTGWLTDDNECEWFWTSTSSEDSVCDSLGRVYEIDLRSNNLEGPIPSELVLLSDTLTRIRVNGNSLSGTIPSFIGGELTNLQRFHAHWNVLSGTIPSNLSELSSSLLSLRLGHNKLLGTLPWQFGDLTKLDALDVSNNDLVGTIPYLLGNMSSLTLLDLNNNELSGTIPFEFMKLKSLINLELNKNNLTGSMPTGVCSRLPLLEVARVDCEIVSCWCCEGCFD